MQGGTLFIAGHRGLVGSALVRTYRQDPRWRLITATRRDLDLTQRPAVEAFFARQRPDIVILAAARVGGIAANNAAPVDFLLDNLDIQNNVMRASQAHGVKKLLFFASSCIYPKHAAQPIAADSLLTGPLEPTSEAYALAKIAGLKLAQAFNRQHGCDFIGAVPATLYGPHDDFSDQGHVLSALVHRFHQAKLMRQPAVTLWGSGTPLREFLHVDDLPEACKLLIERPPASTPINIGSGQEVTIRHLAEMIRDVVGYDGEIRWDNSRPDGAPRKLLDSTPMLALGWRPRISLADGLAATYRWYCASVAQQQASR